MRPLAVALLLLSIGRAAAEVWPEIETEPIGPEAVVEMVGSDPLATQDSLRALLLNRFRGDPVCLPPAEPSDRLISWIFHLAIYAESRDLDRFAATYAPEAWQSADPEGRLPLAVALALQEIGRPREALGWLLQGRPNEAETTERALLEIELREQLGDSAGAEKACRRLRLEKPRDRETLPAARWLLRHHEGGGRYEPLLEESLEMRRTLGPGADEMAARFRALRALERFDEAVSVGDSLLATHPWTRTAGREARRRIEESEGTLSPEEGRLLFPVCLRHALFDEAERLLAVIPDSFPLRLDYLDRLLSARRYDRILRDTDPPGEATPTAERARWYLVHARAARNSLQFETMERYYRAASAMGGATRRTALWEWGREAESEQREGKADSIYSRLMSIESERAEARYRRALSRYAAGRLPEALADLEPLDRPVGNGGAPFWRFRIAEILGDTTTAISALESAMEGGGYYGGRAREEVAYRKEKDRTGGFWGRERNLAFSPRGTGRSIREIPCDTSPSGRRRAERLRLFRRFRRTDWADRQGARLEEELPLERRAEQLLCLGLPDLAIRVAIGTGSTDPTLRYPRPFVLLLLPEARRAGIAVELIWAIARRESLFDPGAISGAGAVGLLQLVDATARATARRWNLADGPLERVDRNVPLGIRHLKDLAEEQDWHLPALLAAYNAGAGKATEWVERSADPDLFIERIGWRETRAYVRHVLDAFWKYRAAYRIALEIPNPRSRGVGQSGEGPDG